MMQYWIYPNPGNADYTSPKVVLLLALCLLFVLASFGVSAWRKRAADAVAKKLSKSWSFFFRLFAILGAVLVISRVEEIQFLSMRILWVIWALCIIAYVTMQYWVWRKKHYLIVPKQRVHDPKTAYIPASGSAKR